MIILNIKNNKIASLKVTNSFQCNYSEKLDLVISNLYEETTNSCVQLPLVGIDMVLELNPDKSISSNALEVNAKLGTQILNETWSKISRSFQSSSVNENFWSFVSSLHWLNLEKSICQRV